MTLGQRAFVRRFRWGKKQNSQHISGEKYSVSKDVEIQLVSAAIATTTCFRKLQFEMRGKEKVSPLVLYLTPDERYLTSELFDTTVDPLGEMQARVQGLLLDPALNKNNFRGDPDARVTLSEFSDFECPFCKRLAAELENVLNVTRAKFGSSTTIFRSDRIRGQDKLPTALVVRSYKVAASSGRLPHKFLKRNKALPTKTSTTV